MIDRPAAIRRAVRTLVARNGFHGASMADVARRAGVATGTAYVHYPSKDELMFATYLELRRELGDAAAANIDADRPAEQRFVQLWCGVHDHLVADPDRAAFLVQFDASPYAGEGQRRSLSASDDPLRVEADRPDLAGRLVDLPLPTLYDLAIRPVVRAVAMGDVLDEEQRHTLARACWRAITRD